MNFKKICSVFVAVVMVLTLVPVSLMMASAEDVVVIDEQSFPDPVFRGLVMDYDLDGNGALSTAEIALVTRIAVSPYTTIGEGDVVTTLQGIEYFTALKTLHIGACGLQQIDLSRNVLLQKLTCQGNSLESLNVASNTELTELVCDGNGLTALDVSNNTKLRKLSCHNNSIAALDVTANTQLEELRCYNNEISVLNLDNNSRLSNLICSNNHLAKLDLSGTAISYITQDKISDQTLPLNVVARSDRYYAPTSSLRLDISKISNLSHGELDNTGFYLDDYMLFYETITYEYSTGLDSSENMVVTLQLNKNYHRVVFYDYYGGELSSSIVYTGVGVTPPAAPDVVGRHFVGWSTTDYTAVNEDLNITPIYDINVYTVTFLDSSGGVLSTQQIPHGSDAAPPNPPEIIGEDFFRWSADYTNMQSDLTIQAEYARRVLTVEFLGKDGELVRNVPVLYGYDAVAPELPQYEGYICHGWDKAFTNITENITVNGVYELMTFSVNFYDYDGTLLSSQTIDYGESAAAPAVPEHGGKIFRSWSEDFASVKSDLEVYAQYIQEYVTVNFYDWEGTLLDSQTVPYGSPVAPPEVDSTFLDDNMMQLVGWTSSTDSVVEDMDVYALIDDLSYKITYHLNDGEFEGEALSKVYYYEELELPVPVKSGSTFAGWYDNADCEGDAFTVAEGWMMQDLEFYAKWETSGVKLSGYVSAMTSRNNHRPDLTLPAVKAAAGAIVEIYSAGELIDSTAVGEDGYFEFSGVSAGDYTVTITGTAVLQRSFAVSVGDSDMVVATQNESIGVIKCNFKSDGYINGDDVSMLIMVVGKPVNAATAMYDLDGNGYINGDDVNIINMLIGINTAFYSAI